MTGNTESRGTGTQGNTQSDSSTKKESQFINQGAGSRQGSNPGRPDQEMDPKNQPGKGNRSSSTQQSGGQGSHADNTGTGSAQSSESGNRKP